MKKISKILATVILSTVALNASAEQWSLEKCIAYAISHNITIKSRELSVEEGEQSLTEAKDNFLPSLNASASQSFSFGRGLTSDNTYADRNVSNFQWGANFNLPLFQGMSEYRRVKMAKSNLQMLLYQVDAAKDDLTLNVISQYLQVLYAKEVTESARSQYALSSYEVERQTALVEAGKVAEADLYDAQSQAAQDKLQVVTSENDTQTALITLANLLQLPTAEGFDIMPLDEGEPMIPTAKAVFDAAMTHNSSIMASRQSIKVADDNISLAKAGYLPRLSFGASIGSSYYTMSGIPNEPFGEQMRHNYSTYIGFSLSIPIFDAFSTRNSVRRAKLQRVSAELQLDQQATDLYRNIQLAYYQALGAREKYLTSAETLEKTEQSFNATREKYNLGRSTPAEFEQAKNNLFRTQVNRIQSHYEYLLRHRILLFYQTSRY